VRTNITDRDDPDYYQKRLKQIESLRALSKTNVPFAKEAQKGADELLMILRHEMIIKDLLVINPELLDKDDSEPNG
jgi:hypothetical protein